MTSRKRSPASVLALDTDPAAATGVVTVPSSKRESQILESDSSVMLPFNSSDVEDLVLLCVISCGGVGEGGVTLGVRSASKEGYSRMSGCEDESLGASVFQIQPQTIQSLLPQSFNGTLVDFSHAWTIPHIWGPEQGLQPSWAFASMAAWDLFCFQREVIGEWNWWADFPESRRNHCRLVAYRGVNGRSIQEFGQTMNESSVYDHLRPRPGRQGPFLPLLNYEGALVYMTQDPPYDPSLFNWRNVGKQGGKNTKGAVTRKRKATAQQPRKGKKIKTVNKPEKEGSPKLTSRA